MALTIDFDFKTEGDIHPDAFLDPTELRMLFEHTRASIQRDLERRLKDEVCEEHGEAPHITISGIYDHENEQMDLQYNIDTCCKLFLLRVTQILNQRV